MRSRSRGGRDSRPEEKIGPKKIFDYKIFLKKEFIDEGAVA